MRADLEMMNVHARVLYTHDSAGRLLAVNEPDNKTIPAARLFLGRTPEGKVWRFRSDLPGELCGRLGELCAREPLLGDDAARPPLYLDEYIRLLEPFPPVQKVSFGVAYRFPECIPAAERAGLMLVTESDALVLAGGFEAMIGELPAWQPFVALVQGGRAVSVCRSARITAEAHEAGVETLPGFRGNNFAAAVVLEWARRVRTLGATPL